MTDGYGTSYIHCYDKAGHYIDSITGNEGEAGAFKCPHSIFMDTRKAQPELYIADRGNRRVQVYDVEGNYLRAFGADFLTSPCAFAVSCERLIIPELRARVGLNGRNRVVERWTWRKCAEQTVEQYREVLAMPANQDKLRRNGRVK